MGEVYQPKKKTFGWIGSLYVWWHRSGAKVFGCSERLHADVKKGYAIFHGKILGTPEVRKNDTLLSHNHDGSIMNLMSEPYHKCERKEYYFSYSKSI